MLAVECLGFVLFIAIGVLRLMVGYRKNWSPRPSEIISVVTFTLACLMGCELMVFWGNYGVKMIIWENQGFTQLQIREKLNTESHFKLIYVNNILSVSTLWLGKASFICAYTSACMQVTKGIKYHYIFTATFTAIAYIVNICLFLFYCSPIERNWQVKSPNFCATVVNKVPINTTMAFNITNDILLLSIPLVLLQRMRVRGTVRSRAEKYGVALIVILGLVSICVSVYRVVDAHVNKYTEGKPLPIGKRNAYITSEMVTTVSLLAAFCLPSIRVLWRSRDRNSSLTPMLKSPISSPLEADGYKRAWHIEHVHLQRI